MGVGQNQGVEHAGERFYGNMGAGAYADPQLHYGNGGCMALYNANWNLVI